MNVETNKQGCGGTNLQKLDQYVSGVTEKEL